MWMWCQGQNQVPYREQSLKTGIINQVGERFHTVKRVR